MLLTRRIDAFWSKGVDKFWSGGIKTFWAQKIKQLKLAIFTKTFELHQFFTCPKKCR